MEPYIGEIRIFAGDFAPQGWLLCKGQLIAKAENEVLFHLIGTTYGGDGVETMGLPNLQSRVVVGQGTLPNGANYLLSEQLGVEEVTLTISQLPAHSHPFTGTVNTLAGGTSQTKPSGNYFGSGGGNTYTPDLGNHPSALAADVVTGQLNVAGGSQPHPNIQPVQAINYIICTSGLFPDQP